MCRNRSKTKEDARTVAKSVICSNLLKCAILVPMQTGEGCCAQLAIQVQISILTVWTLHLNPSKDVLRYAKTVRAYRLMRTLQRKILLEDDIIVAVTLHEGNECATAYGCDLTYDYVKLTAITEADFKIL